MKTEITQNIVRTLQGRKERLYQLRVTAFLPELKKKRQNSLFSSLS